MLEYYPENRISAQTLKIKLNKTYKYNYIFGRFKSLGSIYKSAAHNYI
jgi:hypothetical protein